MRRRRRPPSGRHAAAPSANTGDAASDDPPTDDESPAAEATRVSDTGRVGRRRLGLGLVIVGGLIVLGGLWIGVTALIARTQLNDARADLSRLRTQLSSEDYSGAKATLDDLRSHAGIAHWLTTGPAWALAAHLPAGGQALESARGVAAGVDDLADHALPQLLSARTELDPGKLRKADGAIDLAPVAAAAPDLENAARVVARVQRSVDGLPSTTWISPVDHARTELADQIDDIAGPVRSVALAAKLLPPMLGSDGTQRYFVGFQNGAEARGTGGLPGAFGILTVTHGLAKFQQFENDGYLGRTPTGLDLGTDYSALWGGYEPTAVYVNSSVSANFPYAARIWTAMWQKRSGQHLDGAVAVDPTALGYLLSAAGSAKLKDGTEVSGGDIATLTQSTVYAKYTDNEARKQYLLDLAEAAGKQIVSANGSATGLLSAGRRAVDEGRIRVWSATPSVQAQIAGTPLSGAVERTSAPYIGPVVENATGSKLDFYLDRSVVWKRTGCGPVRTVTATVTLTNTAPASGLPAYVTTRADDPGYATKPGDARLFLDYYATSGARLQSLTVNGAAQTPVVGAELGHPVFSADVELPQGTSRTVVYTFAEPAGSGAPVVFQQPLVRPQKITVEDGACS